MTQICEAIYENGTFRPLKAVTPGLAEGQHVRLVVETDTADEILRLAGQVYAGLSEEQIHSVEQIAL